MRFMHIIQDGRSIYTKYADNYQYKPEEVRRILRYIYENPYMMKTQIAHGVYGHRTNYGFNMIDKLRYIG